MTVLVNDDALLVLGHGNLWFMVVRGLGYLKGAQEGYFKSYGGEVNSVML